MLKVFVSTTHRLTKWIAAFAVGGFLLSSLALPVSAHSWNSHGYGRHHGCGQSYSQLGYYGNGYAPHISYGYGSNSYSNGGGILNRVFGNRYNNQPYYGNSRGWNGSGNGYGNGFRRDRDHDGD